MNTPIGIPIHIIEARINSKEVVTCICVYCDSMYVHVLGMGGIGILIYDYCKAKISRLSRLLLQL